MRRIDKDDDHWTKDECRDPEHSPPTMISLPPGTYEHVCPSCGQKIVVVVQGAQFSDKVYLEPPPLEFDGITEREVLSAIDLLNKKASED